MYNVNYSDAKNVREALLEYFSMTEIRRKFKEKSIKIAINPYITEGYPETWIKVGKSYIILNKYGGWTTEFLASLWWTYHFQAMPEVLKFTPYEMNNFIENKEDIK